jgi:[ribosomal protein S5]-alanine N-acetyltransferase
MRLQLADCVIREYRPEDAESLVESANNRRIWLNLRDRFPHPYTLIDANTWLARATASVPVTAFALTVEDKVIGGIGVDRMDDVFRQTGEVGYWLAEPYWGRGLVTAALKAFSAWAFETLDLYRLEAGVFAYNPASTRVLEKAGYRFEGRLRGRALKDGQRVDELLYARLRDDPQLS